MFFEFNLLQTYNFNHKMSIHYANSNVNFHTNSYKVISRMLNRMKPYFRVEALDQKIREDVYCILDVSMFHEMIMRLARTKEYTVISVPSQFEGGRFSSAYRYEFSKEIVIQYIHNDIIVIINKLDRKIVILGNDIGALSIETRAIIKDNILQRKEESIGSCIFHASSFVYQDKGYLIVGKKGAGKTTTVCSSLLLLEDSKYISNDFVFIDKNKNFYGWPEPIGISPFTCDYFKIDKGIFRGLQISKGKYIIPYREIPGLFNKDLTPGHKLDYIIMPFCDFEEKTEIKRIDSSKAIPTLKAECRTPIDPSRPHWIEFIECEDDYSSDMIQNISDEIPIFELKIGYDFKETFEKILSDSIAKECLV
ncbi:hypothetical protein OCE25_26985 [Bacillus cereus]|nr:hypothetical protein [Bacillus cereus]